MQWFVIRNWPFKQVTKECRQPAVRVQISSHVRAQLLDEGTGKQDPHGQSTLLCTTPALKYTALTATTKKNAHSSQLNGTDHKVSLPLLYDTRHLTMPPKAITGSGLSVCGQSSAGPWALRPAPQPSKREIKVPLFKVLSSMYTILMEDHWHLEQLQYSFCPPPCKGVGHK